MTLSETITALVADPSPANWQRFFDTLVTARLGVIAHTREGKPVPAGALVTTTTDPITLGRKGNLFLACADPTTYRARFPTHPFNADLDATTLFETVEFNPTCEGILVNSAASEHSIPVARTKILELLARDGS